jgi:outer membrane protein
VNDVRAARAQGDAADVGTRAAAAQLALQVKQQYFAALAARETEAAAGAQLAEARQQYAISVAKLRARTATRSDSLRAVIAVRQAELAATTARADRANAEATLTRVVGSDVPVGVTPDGLPPDSALAADSAALARLAADAPLVRQAAAEERVARAQVRSARSAYFPAVSLAYGRNLTAAQPAFDPFGANYVTSGQLRLNVGLPLFDQYSRTRDVANAQIAQANAEAAVRDQRLAAQQTLVQALTGLRTAAEQVATGTESVAAAEEDLRVQRQRYQLGASTLLDVLTSQTQLTNARLSLVQARFAARSARAQLEALLGAER